MLDKDHPYYYLEGYAKQQNLLLNFSRYKYTPDSILDERSVFQKLSTEINEDTILSIMANLGTDEELAIHSNVYLTKRDRGNRTEKYHLPMIDFCTPEWSEDINKRLRHCLTEKIYKELLIFKSGRSFHGYSLCRITSAEWIDFMGRLLLVNPPGTLYVDTRWIGHRIISGYSSLRWSSRTSHHMDIPRFIGHIQQMP